MPIVEILHANKNRGSSRVLVMEITAKIRQVFCTTTALNLKPEQISVHFTSSQVDVIDLPRSEMIVHAWGLSKRPERTQAVLDNLAKELLAAVNAYLSSYDRPMRSLWRVEVLVETWGPDPRLYAEARNP